MAFSAGSQRMIDLWADYEKPTPKEARRRKREHDINAERLPWVLHFTVARKCEGLSSSKPCKISAFWVYITSKEMWWERPGKAVILCTHHMRQFAAEENDRVNDWYKVNGWIKVSDDGSLNNIPYKD